MSDSHFLDDDIGQEFLEGPSDGDWGWGHAGSYLGCEDYNNLDASIHGGLYDPNFLVEVDFLPFQVDSHGDLTLLVGEVKKPFLVCSRSMARASKVFDVMLFGPSKEATASKSKDWSVELPEDDPAAFSILLNIAHAKFDLLPQNATPTSSKH